MNVLITSSRMPVALDEIRKFGRRGHRVFAADTFPAAPGSHSRYVAARIEVAAPQRWPSRFIRDVKALALARGIELIVPGFEEVFYLARHLPELSEVVQLFAPDFALLAQLHQKASFNALARALGMAAPDTTSVTSRDELAAALRTYPRYIARPVWSRGGLDLLTNAGPLAGALELADCHPTIERPWIVQEYVDGVDLCSFSVAQHGRVVAHCTYLHPREIEHGGGIAFESIDEPGTLEFARQLVEATGYHGQIGLDFRRDGRGLVVIECNPRPTAGVHLMPDAMLVDAVLAPRAGAVSVVPAGVRRMYASALVRDLLLHRDRARDDLAFLLSGAHDVFDEPGDHLPALFQAIAYGYSLLYRRRHAAPARRGTSLVAAYFDGISWDGEPIP